MEHRRACRQHTAEWEAGQSGTLRTQKGRATLRVEAGHQRTKASENRWSDDRSMGELEKSSSSTSTMYTLCVYVPPKRTLINPLSAQAKEMADTPLHPYNLWMSQVTGGAADGSTAQQAVGSNMIFPGPQRHQAYDPNAGIILGSANVALRGVRPARAACQEDSASVDAEDVKSANEKQRKCAVILDQQNTCTQNILTLMEQYHIKMARLEHKASSIAAERMYKIQFMPKAVARPASIMFGCPRDGVRFVGTGDYPREADKLLKKSISEKWNMQQFMSALQNCTSYSQYTASSLTPSKNSLPTLQTLMENLLNLNRSGFEIVNSNILLPTNNSGTESTNHLGKHYMKKQKKVKIENEQRFFLKHLLRWLQFKCLMTDPDFKTIIPNHWVAPNIEECETSVANSKKKKNPSLKQMSSLFHEAVTQLDDPADKVDRLRKLMRHLLFASMPEIKKKDGTRTDLQRRALENRISNDEYYIANPDAWLKKFQESGNNTPTQRGCAWPGDITASALPTVLVALLVILYRGHIFVLDDFEPNPSHTVQQIFEATQRTCNTQQQDATYENLKVEKILKDMDAKVCFLFFTQYWCRHS